MSNLNKQESNEIESTFFLAFCGQPVTITVTLTSNVNFSDENGNVVETIPIFYDGILLDYDSDYLYLGENPNEINQAVKKSLIAHIMVKEDKHVFDEILDQMGGPTRKEDVN